MNEKAKAFAWVCLGVLALASERRHAVRRLFVPLGIFVLVVTACDKGEEAEVVRVCSLGPSYPDHPAATLIYHITDESDCYKVRTSLEDWDRDSSAASTVPPSRRCRGRGDAPPTADTY